MDRWIEMLVHYVIGLYPLINPIFWHLHICVQKHPPRIAFNVVTAERIEAKNHRCLVLNISVLVAVGNTCFIPSIFPMICHKSRKIHQSHGTAIQRQVKAQGSGNTSSRKAVVLCHQHVPEQPGEPGGAAVWQTGPPMAHANGENKDNI
jgi:hypothetical protein